jgi:hypothetical protein
MSGPPLKPQRSFPSQSRSAPPQSRNIIPPSVSHQNRPLPDRPYSVAGQYPPPDRSRGQYKPDFSGYLSSPERRLPQEGPMRSSFSGYPSVGFNDPYSPYGMRSGSVTPVIDDETRIRMQYMEKQLESLTHVVQKVLTPTQQKSGIF